MLPEVAQTGDSPQPVADRARGRGQKPAAAGAKSGPAEEKPAAEPEQTRSEKADSAAAQPVRGKGKAAAREGLPTVADFAQLHGVRGPQARYVAENALALFEALRKVHGLPRKRGKLLRTAVLLAGVGAAQDKDEPERAARDLILAQPLHGISTDERLEIACIVALQREKMKPNKEPALEALEPKQRKEAIALACLLQVASALSYNEGLSTRIETAECKGSERCEIKLAGPAAREDARRANARARYWRDNLKHELTFAAVQPAAFETGPEPAAPAPAAEPSADEGRGRIPELPPAEPDQPMAEAGRRIMFPHFMKMLANEAGTRDGEDIEFLHDMRVATRRLRAAYRIFEPFYEKSEVGRFNKELRRAGGALGAVRDLDVLIEKAEAYEASLPPEEGLSLAPLLASGPKNGRRGAGTCWPTWTARGISSLSRTSALSC